MTTVLQLIQNFTDRMGLNTPTALIGSQDKSVKQLRALMREVVQDLSEYRWPDQTLRKEWNAVAGQDQGLIKDILPGVVSITRNTLWFQDRKMQIFGPVPENVWQSFQVNQPLAGPDFFYWISRGHLYLSTNATAGEKLSIIHTTNLNILDVDGITFKELIAADNDSVIFPDVVVNKCLKYKWREQKGEQGWQNDYIDYLDSLTKNISRNTASRVNLSGGNTDPRGRLVSSGSFSADAITADTSGEFIVEG